MEMEKIMTQGLSAYEWGAKWFATGRGCAPGLDAEFMRTLESGKRALNTRRMKEWTNGYLDTKMAYDALEARHNEIGEHIEAIRESDGERMTQYQSECALYGDAGPGQHPSCWAQRSADAIAELKAEAAEIHANMEALRPTPPAPPITEAERKRFEQLEAEGAFDIPF